MTIQSDEHFEITTPTGPMRVHRFYPKDGPPRPAVILYSEIYQITGPIARLAARLAGDGFEVLAPEVYHEYEAPGTVLAYDKPGTDRGNFLKYEKPVAAFDADARAVIDWVLARAEYPWQGVGAWGFCLGGHLAFRAAFDSRVMAAACFYATDLQKISLAPDRSETTHHALKTAKAEFLMIWGRQDPHVPLEARKAIHDAFVAGEANFQWHEFNAVHAFSRDEGPRYDAAASRLGFAMALELFQRRLTVPKG